jgi:hypothetical protein
MVDTASASTTSNNNQKNALVHNADWPESLDFSIQLRCATALGWAMTELLGRCVVFKRELIERIQKNDPLLMPKFGEHTVILSPIRDRRERACAVMGRILFLANVLGISDCKIDRPCEIGSSDPELLNFLTYTEALDKKVKELCNDTQKTAEVIEDICAKINWLLYYWNEVVQVKLQKLPPEVYNGYTVGRGFSTIRWYIGIGAGGDKVYQKGENEQEGPTEISRSEIWFIEHFPGLWHPRDETEGQNLSNKLINEATLEKLLDHLLSMSSYLPPLVPLALEYSLVRWGKTIIAYPRVWRSLIELQNEQQKDKDTASLKKSTTRDWQKNSKREKNMKRALIKQAVVWHDLLTGERDPTTFIGAHDITRRYIRRILLYSLPFLIIGLVFAFVIAFAIIHIQDVLSLTSPTAGSQNPTTKSVVDTVTSAIVTIITAAATIPFVRTLWTWGSNTTTSFVSKNQDKISTAISTTEKNALNLFWQHSQQEAINAKTFVPPLSNPADVDDGD